MTDRTICLLVTQDATSKKMILLYIIQRKTLNLLLQCRSAYLIKKKGNSLSKVETIVNSVNFEILLLHQSNVTNRNFIVFLTIYTCIGVLTLYIYMYQHLINHLLLFYNFIWCLIHTNIGKGTCRNETRISIRYK